MIAMHVIHAARIAKAGKLLFLGSPASIRATVRSR